MKIFRAYDIRGKYPEEINKEIAFKIGSAFGKLIKGKRILVGSDARLSSPELKHSIISGLSVSGKEIVDIGLSTTPMFYFAVNKLGCDGGVMITASHLGKEYNGMKLVEKGGMPLTYEKGIKEIERMVKKEEYRTMNYPSSKPHIYKDMKEDYLNFLVKNKINLKGEIIVDTGNGMTGLIIKDFLERLGVKYTGLYLDVDCTFPNHEANPLKEDTLKDLRKEVKGSDALLGVAFDGDGDRIFMVDENGEVLAGDFMLALIAQRILREGPKKIIYDLRSSRIVPETIRKLGGIPIKSRVGHSYISRKMKEEDIFFGGELSGHFYFKESFFLESSLMALIKVLEMLSESNKTMSELVKPLKKYFKTEEINFKVDDKKGKLEEIENIYSKQGAKIEKIDGITVEFDDWWFNVRPSNTEDLLRLNLEANTEDLMLEKLREVKKIIMG